MKEKSIKVLIICTVCLLIILTFVSCDKSNDAYQKDTEHLTDASETSAPTEEPTDAHVHALGDWGVNVEATCTTAGQEERVCACGEKESRFTPMLDHNFENGICKGCYLAESQGLEYVSKGDGTCYVSGIGECTDADIVIPEEHNGERVTGICEEAFDSCDIVSVVIPNSIETIEDAAFIFCEELERVTLGNGVTNFGVAIFAYCNSMHAVYINDLSAWCDNAVARHMWLIRELYLYGELLTDVVIPEGVTEIKPRTFASCDSIKSVTLPEGLTTIGERAFTDCTELESINIPDTVTSIGEGAFSACRSLTNINIPNGIKIISENAFAMSGLTSVTIPDSVNWIAPNAFSHCRNLTSVTISGSGNTSIDSMVFYRCENLTSVTWGKGVVEIEKSTFSGCKSIESINYGGTKEQWDAVVKPERWEYSFADYVIHCTDGDIIKSND